MAAFNLVVKDLRRDPPGGLSRHAANLIVAEKEKGFDLTVGPLIRATLLQLTDGESLLLLTIHHIVSDYWSMKVLLRELGTLYEAFSQRRSSPLADPDVQFVDYASWERRSLDTGLLGDEAAYWEKQLAELSREYAFKKLIPRNRRSHLQRGQHPLQLDETLFAAIRTACRKEHCTPFMIVVTALSIALHRYTGQSDVRVGTLMAGRVRKEIENAIGPFLNTIILRIHVSPTSTMTEVLAQVRSANLAAHGKQQLPFEYLARRLEAKHTVPRASLFDVLLNYQISSRECLESGGLRIASLGTENVEEDYKLIPTTYHLIFKLRESSTGVTGTVNYSVAEFSMTDIVSLLGSFDSVVKNLVADTNLKGNQIYGTD